jgi:predicted PhzF superfamily epimerase YddE/YHI9
LILRWSRIRWFTPTVEVPLCGHATLASAAVVLERLEPDREAVVFSSSGGPLTLLCEISVRYGCFCNATHGLPAPEAIVKTATPIAKCLD